MALTDALSREVEKRVEAIRGRDRRGEHRQALDGVRALVADRSWDHLDARLKDRILRTTALYVLQEQKDIGEARRLVSEAEAADPQGNNTLVEARLTFEEGDRVPGAGFREVSWSTSISA